VNDISDKPHAYALNLSIIVYPKSSSFDTKTKAPWVNLDIDVSLEAYVHYKKFYHNKNKQTGKEIPSHSIHILT